MKILIVRHGDPNYAIDGLTEKGQREAALLSGRLCRENITALYCSTLGRARLTAAPTLQKLGMDAEYCHWLREFDYAKVTLPYLDKPHLCWDLLPEFASSCKYIYSPTQWQQEDFIKNSDIPAAYAHVCQELDSLLARHGYRRNGLYYTAEKPNHDTIVLVCHFGVTAVLLSHLINCSPYSIWQGCVTLPTSVTTLYTEERRQGVASFRCCGFGDISHLYETKEAPAFSGRFCECFTDSTRHD